MRKLNSSKPASVKSHSIKPNEVANAIFKTSYIKITRKYKKYVKQEYRNILKSLPRTSELVKPILDSEIIAALDATKNGKFAGPDDIPPEFRKKLGPKAKTWLAKFYSHILLARKIPTDWKHSKILAMLKPGKNDDVKNYRPISLLNSTYKLFERLLLNRIYAVVEKQ